MTVDCKGGNRGRTTFKYVTGKVTITRRVGRLSIGAWIRGCKCTTPSIVCWGKFALPMLLSIIDVLRASCFDGSVFVGVLRIQKWGRVLVLAASRECSACCTQKVNPLPNS